MRWKFIDPTNHQEQAQRAKIVGKIDAWWKAFAATANEFDAAFTRKSRLFQNKDDIAMWIHKYLGAVSPRLMWEFGPALRTKGHRLVITPEAARHLRPLTKAILKRAPQIAGWEFYQYRVPEDVEMTHQTIQARTQFDSSAFQVRMSRGQHNRIDLCYFAPSIASSEDQNALHAAFVATETLLGEELLDKWVGLIEVGPLQRPTALGSLFGKRDAEIKHLIPLERAKETFDAVVQSVRDQLPPTPHSEWIDEAQWCSLKMQPPEASDYTEWNDLFVAITANQKCWSAAHEGTSFYSERFSRCGETFCFIKIDGMDGLGENCEFSDRAETEDALNEALRTSKLGCTIGGGTGLRYSYIDLALADLGQGIQAVRKRLSAARIPKRAWIQFFDSDLAAEWIGIYDDTPPPPLPNFDEAN